MARRWQPRQLHHRQVAFVVWNKRYPRQPWFDALNQAALELYLRTGVLSAGGGMR